MSTIWLYIGIFFALGVLGTALGGRHKPAAVRRQRWLKLWTYLLIVVILVYGLLYTPVVVQIAALLIVAGGAWELMLVGRQKPQTPLFYLTTALFYLFVAAGFWKMCAQIPAGLQVYTFLIVFVFDGFCQITGQLAGKHPLFPVTSPNKTVEGLLGGAVFALGTAWATRYWVPLGPAESLLAGGAIAAAALAGDYLASAYKRRHGVKDYSRLLPGHGGVLDRFDSWLVAGAVVGWWGG